MNSLYFLLFQDSFRAGVIFPFREELVLPAALAFGAAPAATLFGLAFVAGLAGLCFDWALGRGLLWLQERHFPFPELQQCRYAKIAAFVTRYGKYVLLGTGFSGIGAVLALFSGFFRVRFPIAVMLFCLGKLLYYGVRYGSF